MSTADETKIVLDFLEDQAPILTTFSTRIWGDAEQPKAGYVPANGPAICFKVRGGRDGDPGVLLDPSFQFKIYGNSEVIARGAARTLHDNFEAFANKDILAVRRETLPVTLQEPETDWIYCLTFYQVMVRSLP
jgi:hypothetical protein